MRHNRYAGNILVYLLSVFVFSGSIQPVTAEDGNAPAEGNGKENIQETSPAEDKNFESASTSSPSSVSNEDDSLTEMDQVKNISVSTELLSGYDEKNAEGVYVWNAENSTAGHAFTFQINYGLSVKDAGPEEIQFSIPKSILTDRGGNSADSVDWSIPSKADADAGVVSEDTEFAYYDNGNNQYVIYNLNSVPAGKTGYFQLSYRTTESTFNYVDMHSMTPFTCTMMEGSTSSASSESITVAINTSASITSTKKEYPSDGKIKEWNSSWGNAADLGITDSTQYYYLIWNIDSNVSATQPYTFEIDDQITGNKDGMFVVGYHFSGNTAYQKENTVTNQTISGTRWDSVLTAIPLEQYQNEEYWKADNTETAKVTPEDKLDPVASGTASQSWQWSKPEFHEPGGQFNAYVRGDGAYRTYGNKVFSGAKHDADNLNFKAGTYTRYDLEQFNGYDNANVSLDSYDGFDYASWMIGYPYPWTEDTSAEEYNADEPWTAYGKKPVKYVLTDDGFYLINSEDALTSSDGSKRRTIENGGISKDKAIKLTNNDFRINKLEFTTFIEDADYDSTESGEYKLKAPVYTANDILVFEGKFNVSDNWVKFAEYNLSTSTGTPVADYVSSMDNHQILFKDDQDLTAYRVIAVNAHYYTEVYTVSSITLKKSEVVQNLIKPSDTDKNAGRVIGIVNNNTGSYYKLKDDVTYADKDFDALAADENWEKISESDPEHSDTDYAIASQKNSSLTKDVISSANNTKRRYYTITWRLAEQETVISGEEGTMSYLPQSSGIFYDLLPAGSNFVKDSVQVIAYTSRYDFNILPESSYEIKTISNYDGTGRTMIVVQIKEPANYYAVEFDTRHAWSSIKDYGTYVYNPTAYETGNDSITNGSADNGGKIQQAAVMADLSRKTDITQEAETGNKFLYAECNWDINALTSASSGLTKKVKAEEDSAYASETKTHIKGNYSYELRFMNDSSSTTKDLILFDSLENYKDGENGSDWKGTLQSMDVSQIRSSGAEPVVYISTKENLDLNTYHDLEKDVDESKNPIWIRADANTDLSMAKAVAIDLRYTGDQSDFILHSEDSVAAYLYMKAPDTAPEARTGEAYPYAYNNVYISGTTVDTATGNSTTFLSHQDYTKTSLTVTGNISVHKVDAVTKKPISNIAFHLFGTSNYKTDVNLTATSDQDGMIAFNNVEKGNYVLQETDATDDYLLDPTEHRVVIDGSGNTLIDGVNYSNASMTIENQPRIHADVQFSKVDSLSTSVRLPGAEYRLSGTSDYGTDVLMTAVSQDGASDDLTSNRGLVEFKNIEKGTYTLKETKAPEDHVLDTKSYTVTVDNDGNVSINYPEPYTVYETQHITKYSHTSNIDDNGVAATTAPNTLNNTDTVTIPGAEKLHIKMWYSTGSQYSSWFAIYPAGIKPSDSNYSQASISNGKLYGGNKTTKEEANVVEYDADGDTVQFYSYAWYPGDCYGYYAVITADVKVPVYTDETVEQDMTKYSHTSNISDDGTQGGDYGSNWTNANITGTDRGDTSKAHVVTIPGADKIHVKITWGGESPNWDWATVWSGAHREYTANDNYSSGINGCQQLGGGSHTSTSNTKEFDVNGDSVTFGFKSDSTGSGDGYGYYAVVTGRGLGKAIKTTAVAETNALGIYILKDEPLHYIAFTKKSSYDNSAVGNATFSLIGTSDNGTAVNKTAISDADTGTVRFNGLESGNYILQETEAPEGYEKDDKKYFVQVMDNGRFSIDGLTKTDNVYDFYDAKKQDKQITITKVWDDGETSNSNTNNGDRVHTKEENGIVVQDPSKLRINLQTTVVPASLRTFKIKFDANGGTFSGGNTENIVSFNAKNVITDGEILTPMGDNEKVAEFIKWTTDYEGRNEVDFSKLNDKNNLDNSYLNNIKDKDTVTVYAQYFQQRYAVSIYGIEQDVDKNGNKMGLTFGPAILNRESYSHNHGLFTSEQPENDDELNTHSELRDNETTALGNKYRCMHFDNWKTIIYWNNKDPYVYEKCIKEKCTHSVMLRPGKQARDTTFIGTAINYGITYYRDGPPVVSGMLGSKSEGYGYYDNRVLWDSVPAANENYGCSRIRALLNGQDEKINKDIAYAAGETEFTAENSILSALPEELRNAIGEKDVRYASTYNNHDPNAIQHTYDKLWLLSNSEVFGNSLSDAYKYSEGDQYEVFKEVDVDKIGEHLFASDLSNTQIAECIYLRSLYDDPTDPSSYDKSAIGYKGLTHRDTTYSNKEIRGTCMCLSFGFALSRSSK